MDDYKLDADICKYCEERNGKMMYTNIEPAISHLYELLNDVDEQQTIESWNDLHEYLEITHGNVLDKRSANLLCSCLERAKLQEKKSIHIFVSCLNILANGVQNSYILTCSHNLLEKLLDCFRSDMPEFHATIFGIVEIYCNEFQNSRDVEFEEKFLDLLELLLNYCFDKNPELNFIRPAMFRPLTSLIKTFDNFHDRAEQIYTAFTSFIFSDMPFKGDSAPIIKAFRIFLKKESSYYTNFIGDRVAPRLVELITVSLLPSAREAIKVILPLLDSADFIEVLLEAGLFKRLIDFLQIPSLVFPLAIHALQLMNKSSEHVCNLIEESGFLRRPQLYNNQIYGYIIRKDILALICNQIEHEIMPRDPKQIKMYKIAIVSAFEDTDEEILRLCLSNLIALARNNPEFTFESDSDSDVVAASLERIIEDSINERNVILAECLKEMLYGDNK